MLTQLMVQARGEVESETFSADGVVIEVHWKEYSSRLCKRIR